MAASSCRITRCCRRVAVGVLDGELKCGCGRGRGRVLVAVRISMVAVHGPPLSTWNRAVDVCMCGCPGRPGFVVVTVATGRMADGGCSERSR